MRSRPIFVISGLGAALAVASAIIFSQEPKAQPPAFSPAANPYAKGIYANGIVESEQPQGENVTIYPEVAGPVTRVLVAEGAQVGKGDVLLTIDDSVQRATAEQQKSQLAAARALLQELKAQPRKETLDVAAAQVENAKAALKSAADSRAKLERSYEMAPQSVSLDTLDTARNAEKVAAAALEVTRRQYDLTRAGAWVYDIQNQEAQTEALAKAAAASEALLAKYSIRAPVDGTVLAVQAGVGSYVSTQGAYGSYTQGYGPLILMGMPGGHMAVRAFVDEILVHRLPQDQTMQATLFVRGTDVRIPLSFVRVQPYVSPKIELADQRLERVDVRVLPVIFRFDKPKGVTLYPGQLVDVYIGEK
jgi:HlyD family secretion protein